MNRKRLSRAVTALLFGTVAPAHAQTPPRYPTKPILVKAAGIKID